MIDFPTDVLRTTKQILEHDCPMDSSHIQQNASSISLKTRVMSPQTQIAVIRLNRGEEKGPKGYGAETLRLHQQKKENRGVGKLPSWMASGLGGGSLKTRNTLLHQKRSTLFFESSLSQIRTITHSGADSIRQRRGTLLFWGYWEIMPRRLDRFTL